MCCLVASYFVMHRELLSESIGNGIVADLIPCSRHRRGQPGDRSLAERATAAAWVRNTDETNPANPTAALNARGNSRGHSMESMQPTAASELLLPAVLLLQNGRAITILCCI